MKATLVLLPLLGITYMLFFVNPGEDEVSRVVFIYFNSFLESFQVPAFSLSSLSSLSSLLWLWENLFAPIRVRILLAEAWRIGGLEQPGLVRPHSPLTPLFPSGLLRVCVLLFSEQ